MLPNPCAPWYGMGSHRHYDDPLVKWLGSGEDMAPNRYPWVLPSPTVVSRPPTTFALPLDRTTSSKPQLATGESVAEAPVDVERSGATYPSAGNSATGLRRSTRGWHPSAAALQQIAANDLPGDVAARVDELLLEEEDLTLPAEKCEFFQSEVAHSTQDSDVPRTYAQVLRLPPDEKLKWLQAAVGRAQATLPSHPLVES